MAQFLTLIHSGGGSQVEAAGAQAVLGPWPDHDKANEVGKQVHNTLAQVDSYFRDEYFWTVVEIPDPPATDLINEINTLLDDHGYDNFQVVTIDEARDFIKHDPDSIQFADPSMERFFT